MALYKCVYYYYYYYDTHTRTQTEVQRSVGLKDRVEQSDGRTDGRTIGRHRLLYLPANAVGKYGSTAMSPLHGPRVPKTAFLHRADRPNL